MEKHYTLLKAAELLGVTTQTLRNWDNAGKIRTIRTPGNQRRIPESEIAKFLSPVEAEPITKIVEPITEPEQFDMPSIITGNDNHLLMCKDTAIYDITQSQVLNENLLPGCMLKTTKSFSEWMATRCCEDTNFSSQRLAKRALGISDYEHIAFTTGAFSLSDCYWIKRNNEEINFDEITPYIHKEWDAMEADSAQNEYIWGPLSNLFISGKRDKRWLDARTLLKVNTPWEIEPYKLCVALGLDNIPQVQAAQEGILLGNFTSPNTFYETMEQFGITEDITDPRDIFIEKYKEPAVALFVIDYLVENNDRHPDDYGFLRSSSTGEYIAMAPYHNFDWIWSGDSVALPEAAWRGYSGYISSLCQKAISAARNFEYGTTIERRAAELLKASR